MRRIQYIHFTHNTEYSVNLYRQTSNQWLFACLFVSIHGMDDESLMSSSIQELSMRIFIRVILTCWQAIFINIWTRQRHRFINRSGWDMIRTYFHSDRDVAIRQFNHIPVRIKEKYLIHSNTITWRFLEVHVSFI